MASDKWCLQGLNGRPNLQSDKQNWLMVNRLLNAQLGPIKGPSSIV